MNFFKHNQQAYICTWGSLLHSCLCITLQTCFHAVEDDSQSTNNKVKLYIFPKPQLFHSHIYHQIYCPQAVTNEGTSVFTEYMLKRYLFGKCSERERPSVCMKSRLLQVSTSFIMPIAYVPYFIIDNT